MPPGILRCNSECPIHPKTAIFNRPIQGGFAHQKRYARVQPGHSVHRLLQVHAKGGSDKGQQAEEFHGVSSKEGNRRFDATGVNRLRLG